MEDIKFGGIEYITKINEDSEEKIIELAEKYLKQANCKIFDLKFDEYNEDYGYLLEGVDDNGYDCIIGFSDYFVSLEYESKVDPIWINILSKNLKKTDPMSNQTYLNEVNTLIEVLDENKDELGVDSKDLKLLKDCMLSIEAGSFDPNKQVLSDQEKIITMLSLGD